MSQADRFGADMENFFQAKDLDRRVRKMEKELLNYQRQTFKIMVFEGVLIVSLAVLLLVVL